MENNKLTTIRNSGIIFEIKKEQDIETLNKMNKLGIEAVLLDAYNSKWIEEIRKDYPYMLIGLNIAKENITTFEDVDFVVSNNKDILKTITSQLALLLLPKANIENDSDYPIIVQDVDSNNIKNSLSLKNVVAVTTSSDLKEAVDQMLGLKLTHIGFNCENEEEAMQIAKILELAFHMPYKVGNSSIFSGSKEFELMKKPGRGKNGHIAIVVSDIDRGIHYLTKRGFAFEEASLVTKDETKIAIYLANEIAGFAFHLVRG